MNIKTICGFVMAYVLLAAGGAYAADTTVTFHVPVSLYNLHPDVNTVGVRCWIMRADGKGVGTNLVTFPVTAGQSYNKTLLVPVTMTQSGAEAAVSWKCMLGFNPQINGMTVPSYTSPTNLGKAKPGTPLTVEVNGKFTNSPLIRSRIGVAPFAR
ncbi:MAG TPA: hypothetical protein VNH42_04810 [Mariprofundaceae bacterium]|nr:hypothetical protein [Mariprofundaceae bacterium]